jgi:phosphatidylserine/phosphatidylglycerophosphate/cardiolipin synthase-like enzyme
VLIDDEETFVGSFNLDPRSVSLNSEQGVLVTDAALGEELQAYFQRMTAPVHSWRVDLDEHGDTRWTDEHGSTTKTPGVLRASDPRGDRPHVADRIAALNRDVSNRSTGTGQDDWNAAGGNGDGNDERNPQLAAGGFPR